MSENAGWESIVTDFALITTWRIIFVNHFNGNKLHAANDSPVQETKPGPRRK